MKRLYEVMSDQYGADHAAFSQCIHVIADNVAEYCYGSRVEDEWDIAKDFPVLTPPLHPMFISYHLPKQLMTKKGWVPFVPELVGDTREIGALFLTRDLRNGEHDPSQVPFQAQYDAHIAELTHLDSRALAKIKGAPKSDSRQMYSEALSYLPEAVQIQARTVAYHLGLLGYFMVTDAQTVQSRSEADSHFPRWLVNVSLYRKIHGRGAVNIWNADYFLDSTGRLRHTLHVPVHQPTGTITVDSGSMGAISNGVFPAFMAINLMHCKNVKMVEGDPLPPALAKRTIKRRGRLPRPYYFLDIQPMQKVLESEGHAGEVGVRQAWHVVRGNFAHYSEERPAFGKPGMVGTWWRNQHVRGSKEEGEIQKGYRVHLKK